MKTIKRHVSYLVPVHFDTEEEDINFSNELNDNNDKNKTFAFNY